MLEVTRKRPGAPSGVFARVYRVFPQLESHGPIIEPFEQINSHRRSA